MRRLSHGGWQRRVWDPREGEILPSSSVPTWLGLWPGWEELHCLVLFLDSFCVRE